MLFCLSIYPLLHTWIVSHLLLLWRLLSQTSLYKYALSSWGQYNLKWNRVTFDFCSTITFFYKSTHIKMYSRWGFIFLGNLVAPVKITQLRDQNTASTSEILFLLISPQSQEYLLCWLPRTYSVSAPCWSLSNGLIQDVCMPEWDH